MEFYIKDVDESGNRNKLLGVVRMSPQQAIALKTILENHIKLYSDKFQDIKLPEELKKRLFEENLKENYKIKRPENEEEYTHIT
jgi:hypothetical protein